MKALLDKDLIIGWTTKDSGVEVGTPPPGIGLERLRFDGSKIVDLATLTTIHVALLNKVFSLHCVAVPTSQPVYMTYTQRKMLFDDGGTYRLKTDVEILAESVVDTTTMLKVNLRKILDKELGDTPDQMADVSKCLIIILTYLAGGDGADEAKAVIDSIAPAYAGIYSMPGSQDKLTHNAATLKIEMANYYQSVIS